MERVKLVVHQRDDTGTRNAKRLRKKGLIPGVLYGSGNPAAAIAVEATVLRAAMSTDAGSHAVLDVSFEGQKKTHVAIVKDVALDKVKHVVTHFDLQEIRLTEPIETTVGLQIEGTPHGVTMGGILDVTEHELTVRGLPTDIPEHLTLNVESLDVGDHARLGDIVAPEGITIIGDPEETVCTVLAPKVVVEEVEEAAAEAVAEGEPELVGKTEEGEEPAER
jgi:large subunit ribosomal protein L25